MKKILYFFFLFPLLLSAQNLTLSEAIPVAENGTGNRAPRVAVLENNRPVVYWGKTGFNPKLYLSIWDNGSFGDPMELSTNGIEPDLWGGSLGPQIAAKGQLIFLVFENYGQGIYCIRSEDGGESFSSPVSVVNLALGRVATLPSISIDNDGQPIVSFVTTNSSEQEAQYEITKSTDGGQTFLPTTIANVAAPGGEVCECCPASIGVGQGNETYLGFRNNENGLRDIWVAKADADSLDFNQATNVDDTDWQLQSCPQSGPDLLVGNDSIYSVFFSGADGTNIYFSSLDQTTMEKGQQFQIPSLSGDDKNQNYPAIAGNVDTLAVVWQELGNNGWEIMMAWSVNGAAELLNNLVEVDTGIQSQKQPDIVFQNQRFHIVYEDGATGKVMYRVASFDGFVESVEKVKESFKVDLMPNPTSNEINVQFEYVSNKLTQVSLLTEDGNLLLQKQGLENEYVFDLSSYPNGIYLLKIESDGMEQTQKVIKQ